MASSSLRDEGGGRKDEVTAKFARIHPLSLLLYFFQTERRPVLESHTESKPARSEHFLDLVERFAAKVRGLQQFGLGTLDQVADVVYVFRLQAVSRAHGELEVVDRTQQDRVDLLGLGLLDLHRRALEIGKYHELVDQNARRVTDGLFGLDRAVGFDVNDQLVEVGTLLDTRRVDLIADAAHRA